MVQNGGFQDVDCDGGGTHKVDFSGLRQLLLGTLSCSLVCGTFVSNLQVSPDRTARVDLNVPGLKVF